MALTDLTRISTSGIATGTSLSGAILHGDAHFRGTNAGINSAIFDSSDNALEFNDNVQLKFGNSADLRLYHDGSHSHIFDNGTGDLRLTTGGQKIDFQKTGGDVLARFYTDGQSELYHASNLKITTDQAGAKVTGVLTATSFSGPLIGSPINNPSGISTFYDLRVSNNLTVEGSTTTLDTNLIGVDRVEVGANSNTVTGIAVTQSGTADIVRLYDGASQVVTVDDTGNVGIGITNPSAKLDILARGDTEKGIRLLDSNDAQSAPYIEVIGKRSDGNTSQGFGGKIHLAKNFTNNKINNGNMLGTVAFGGNHTDGTEANILYTASISAIASDSFDSATDMPTDLIFLTSRVFTGITQVGKTVHATSGSTEAGDFFYYGSAVVAAGGTAVFPSPAAACVLSLLAAISAAVDPPI